MIDGNVCDSRIEETFPNIDLPSGKIEQFHRLCRNWYWHSSIPILAPPPMIWKRKYHSNLTTIVIKQSLSIRRKYCNFCDRVHVLQKV